MSRVLPRPSWPRRVSPLPVLARAALWAYHKLHALAAAVVPAELPVLDLAVGLQKTQLLHVAARLRIADALGEGPRNAEDLARALNVNADALHRALRALAAMGIFELGSDGTFRNNRLSDVLKTRPERSVRDFLDYLGNRSNVHAYADLLEVIRTGEGAFERVNGASLWAWFAEHPEEGQTFASAMAASTHDEAPLIAAGYPFGQLARICDVAGGRGALLAELLARFKSVSGVLFDEAHVLALADDLLRSRGVLTRVQKVAGSFFEQVPDGCDGYLLKDILHDWDDARALAILRTVRRAMRPDARLFVIESVFDRNEPDHLGCVSDVHMMVMCEGGRQRSAEELERLFEQAGLRLLEARPVGPLSSIVVGEPS